MTENQPKTRNEAVPQKAPKKFLFFNALKVPIAASMVTSEKIIIKTMKIPLIDRKQVTA